LFISAKFSVFLSIKSGCSVNGSRALRHDDNNNNNLHPFNGLFSRKIWVSQHQKDKPFWILMKQEMMGWHWHQLDIMQIICTSLQTDNHTSISPLSFYRLDALPATQPTASKH